MPERLSVEGFLGMFDPLWACLINFAVDSNYVNLVRNRQESTPAVFVDSPDLQVCPLLILGD